MDVSFASPAAALIGLAGLLPILALVAIERRARSVRRILGLRAQHTARLLPEGVAIVLVVALVSLAAAQPLLAVNERQRVRGDVEIYMVVDTSRSMLAAASARADTRFERARRHAIELRRSLPTVRVGLASLTDRLLPHLFPTTNAGAFEASFARAVAVDRPPPRLARRRASEFASLADAPTWNFFSEVRRRLLVVFTDGEGQSGDPNDLRFRLEGQPAVQILFVHTWDAAERVFDRGRVEEAYVADSASRGLLELMASVGDGEVFAEDELERLRSELGRRIGSAPQRIEISVSGTPLPLAPYAIGAALLPLGLLLWRRNRA